MRSRNFHTGTELLLCSGQNCFQEVAPGLRSERLHPIHRCVINELVWIETVSF